MHRLRPWGFPTVSPSHPSAFPHHGIQRITVEFSEKCPNCPLRQLGLDTESSPAELRRRRFRCGATGVGGV